MRTFFWGLLVLASGLFAGCRKSEVAVQKSAIIESAGQLHNDALGHVHELIQAGADSAASSKQQYLLDWFAGKGMECNPEIAQKERLERETILQAIRDCSWSRPGKKLLLQVYESAEATKEGRFTEVLDQLQEQAMDDAVPKEEREHLMLAISIARSSSDFWAEHIPRDEQQPDNGRGFFKSIIAEIACKQTDVGGAIFAIIKGESVMDIIRESTYQSSLMLFYIEHFM